MGYTHYYSLTRRPSVAAWEAFTAELREILAHPAISGIVCRESDRPDEPPEIGADSGNLPRLRFFGRSPRLL